MPELPLPIRGELLLPHAGRMCCIDQLIALEGQEATAEVTLNPNHVLLNSKGQLDRSGFIELAAQTAGAMQGAQIMCCQSEKPSLAMLAGIQGIKVYADASVGDCLEIHVTTLGELDGMSSLAFTVKRQDELLAEGRLKVFMPEASVD